MNKKECLISCTSAAALLALFTGAAAWKASAFNAMLVCGVIAVISAAVSFIVCRSANAGKNEEQHPDCGMDDKNSSD